MSITQFMLEDGLSIRKKLNLICKDVKCFGQGLCKILEVCIVRWHVACCVSPFGWGPLRRIAASMKGKWKDSEVVWWCKQRWAEEKVVYHVYLHNRSLFIFIFRYREVVILLIGCLFVFSFVFILPNCFILSAVGDFLSFVVLMMIFYPNIPTFHGVTLTHLRSLLLTNNQQPTTNITLSPLHSATQMHACDFGCSCDLGG